MEIKRTGMAMPASRPTLRRLLWTYGDLALLLAAVAVGALLLDLSAPLLRVPLGLGLSLLAPGYALAAALFPTRENLDAGARGALSFGLSLAVLPLMALGLNSLPWGLRPWPMVIALSGWIVLLSAVAALRRYRLLRPTSPARDVLAPPARWHGGRFIWSGAALLALGMWGLLSHTGLISPPPSQGTVFYTLNAAGQLEDYPRELAPGVPAELRLGIINQEPSAQSYRIEVRAGATLLTTVGPLLIAPGATWEQPVRYALRQPGDDQQIEILLMRAGASVPYRRLALWANVREPQR